MTNKSIRDNIVFGRPVDEEWYLRVVGACCLGPDLGALPDGDRTEVGERGVNLSGGQRQRINLARCVYARPDVVLLDDCFSALDVNVGNAIFDQCFSPAGILCDSIRIVVTHQHHLLCKEGVDCIHVMGAEGRVIASGDYRHIEGSDDPLVRNLLQSANHKEVEGTRLTEAESMTDKAESKTDIAPTAMPPFHPQIPSPKNTNPILDIFSKVIVSKNDGNNSPISAHGAGAKQSNDLDTGTASPTKVVAVEEKQQQHEVVSKSTPKSTAAAFVKDETKETGSVKLSVIASYLAGYGSWLLLVVLVAVILGDQSSGVFQSIFYTHIASHCQPREDAAAPCTRSYNIHVMKILGCIAGGILILRATRIALYIHGAQTAAKAFHNRMLESLLSAKVSFFDTQLSGRILNRFVGDMSAIDLAIPQVFFSIVGTVLAFSSTVILVALELPVALVGLVVVAIPYHKIYSFYRWPARDLKRLDSMAKSPINSHLVNDVELYFHIA